MHMVVLPEGGRRMGRRNPRGTPSFVWEKFGDLASVVLALSRRIPPSFIETFGFDTHVLLSCSKHNAILLMIELYEYLSALCTERD